MSKTQIEITAPNGTTLGVVATTAELATVIKANPDATYDIKTVVENPCVTHPSFEADNCPGCGTAATLGTEI